MSIVSTTTMPGINRQGKRLQVFKIRERQLLQKQAENITYADNPPNPQPGRSAGSAQSPQSG